MKMVSAAKLKKAQDAITANAFHISDKLSELLPKLSASSAIQILEARLQIIAKKRRF